MPLSYSPLLRILAALFATIYLAFGLQFTLSPSSALTYFSFSTPNLPSTPSDQHLAESLTILYAVRDLFMAVAIYAAAWFGERRTLGVMLLAGGVVAGVDGWVCKVQAGEGEWNHWGYGPVVGVVGGLLLGVADGRDEGKGKEA